MLMCDGSLRLFDYFGVCTSLAASTACRSPPRLVAASELPQAAPGSPRAGLEQQPADNGVDEHSGTEYHDAESSQHAALAIHSLPPAFGVPAHCHYY